jgi:tetratricopeptide (TPR) repeat protein
MFAVLQDSKPRYQGLLLAVLSLSLVALVLIGSYSWDYLTRSISALVADLQKATLLQLIALGLTLLGLSLTLWWRYGSRRPVISKKAAKEIADVIVEILEKRETRQDPQATVETLARQSDRIAAAGTNVEAAIDDLNESKDADSGRVVQLLAVRDIQGAKNELRRIFERRERQGVAAAQDARRLAAFTRGDDPWGSAALYGKAARQSQSIRNLIDFGDVSVEASELAQAHRKQALIEAARAYEEARTRAQGVPEASQLVRDKLSRVLEALGYGAGEKIELPDSLNPQARERQDRGPPTENAIKFVANYLDQQRGEKSKRTPTLEEAKRVLDGILTTKGREEGEGYKEAWEAAQHLATLYRHEEEWIRLGDVYRRAADLAEKRSKEDFAHARDASQNAYEEGPFEEAAKQDEDAVNRYGVPLAIRLGNLLEELGDELRVKGELQAALRFYEKSRNVRRTCDLRRDLAVIEEKIGDVLVEEGKISELLQARRDLGIAKMVAKRNTNDERLSFNLWRDADVLEAKVKAKVEELMQNNRLQAALKAYRAADDQTWSQQQLAELYGKIGDVLFAQGELDEAENSYDKSLRKDKLGDLLLAYGEREKAEKAAVNYTSALSDHLQRPATGVLKEKLGDAHWASNDDTGAQTSYDGALRDLTLQAEHDKARLQAKLGDAWVTDDEMKTYESYSESRAIRKNIADAQLGNRDLQTNLARAHERLGDFLYGVWKQSLKPDKRTASLVEKIPVEKITRDALSEWNSASEIYTKLVGEDPRASESLLLVEPLWRVGELKGEDGFAELDKADAFLLAASKHLKPYQRGWRKQINDRIQDIPREKRKIEATQ